MQVMTIIKLLVLVIFIFFFIKMIYDKWFHRKREIAKKYTFARYFFPYGEVYPILNEEEKQSIFDTY